MFNLKTAALALCLLVPMTSSAERATGYADAIDKHLKAYLAQEKVGLAAAVIKIERDGSITDLYLRDFASNRGKDHPARLHLASLSKHFTGAAIARLENLKKLDISDKVKNYVRDWPDYANSVKISHLLEHRSGLPDYTDTITACYFNNRPKELIGWLNKRSQTKAGLKYTPGDRYRYNNTNYVVLARIVENISQKSFPTYMETHFFKPFKMGGTELLKYEERRLKNTLDTYKWDGKDKYTVNRCDFMPGDGGVFSHIQDLRKWSKFLAGKSEKYGAALSPYLYARDTKGYSHGLKMGSGGKVCGRNTRTHDGSWRGAKTQMIYVPNLNLFAYVLCNGAKCGKTITKATREMLKVYFDYQYPDEEPCK